MTEEDYLKEETKISDILTFLNSIHGLTYRQTKLILLSLYRSTLGPETNKLVYNWLKLAESHLDNKLTSTVSLDNIIIYIKNNLAHKYYSLDITLFEIIFRNIRYENLLFNTLIWADHVRKPEYCKFYIKNIAGNPFLLAKHRKLRQITPLEKQLAESAYDKDYSENTLHILADAVEENGCPWGYEHDKSPILHSLRQNHPFKLLKGYWAVDYLREPRIL